MRGIRPFLFLIFVLSLPLLAIKKPTQNLVLFVTDEQGQLSTFYRDSMSDWWNSELSGEKFMREHGVTFSNYYANTLACTPIRTLIDTGLYPRVTGCIKTDGFATPNNAPEMTWLPVENGRSVFPTMGHFLQAGGYKAENIYHLGKFHLANLDIMENGQSIPTVDDSGNLIQETLYRYLQENLYEPFGYKGKWGEEPHGREWRNSAMQRDKFFVQQALNLIKDFSDAYQKGDKEPFVLKINLVNPHDVVLAVGMWMHNQITDDMRNIPIPPAAYAIYQEKMEQNEAQVTKAYRDIYPLLYSDDPIVKEFYESEEGRAIILSLYFWLMREVENQVMQIIEALKAAPFFKDTWIVKTSDHGDMLGVFGLWQKWHTLRKEVTHIPFSVYHPTLITEPRSVSALASHADLLPTILGLLGIDLEEISHSISEQFPSARKLMGRDLTPVILDQEEPDYVRPVYFITEDEISNGSNNYAALSGFQAHNPVEKFIMPSKFPVIKGLRRIEGIRFFEGCMEWVLYRYFDPDNGDEEWYAYNLSNDEHEITNIIGMMSPEQVTRFKNKLAYESERYNNPPPFGEPLI